MFPSLAHYPTIVTSCEVFDSEGTLALCNQNGEDILYLSLPRSGRNMTSEQHQKIIDVIVQALTGDSKSAERRARRELMKDWQIDGTAEDDTLQGDGERAPFAIFAPDLQLNVGGPYASRADAQKALDLIANGVSDPWNIPDWHRRVQNKKVELGYVPRPEKPEKPEIPF